MHWIALRNPAIAWEGYTTTPTDTNNKMQAMLLLELVTKLIIFTYESYSVDVDLDI